MPKLKYVASCEKFRICCMIFIVVLWYDVSVSMNYSVKWTFYPFVVDPVLLNFSVTPIFKWQSISKSFVQRTIIPFVTASYEQIQSACTVWVTTKDIATRTDWKVFLDQSNTIQSKQHCCHVNCKTHELSVTYIFPSPCSNFNCCSIPSSTWQRQCLKHY